MTVSQDTTFTYTRYVAQTISLPRTITEQTDTETAGECVTAYSLHSASDVNMGVIAQFITAVQEGAGLVVLYTHDGETTARVLYPTKVTLTNDNNLVAWAFCTMRGMYRSFRLDRCVSVHELTLPTPATVAA